MFLENNGNEVWGVLKTVLSSFFLLKTVLIHIEDSFKFISKDLDHSLTSSLKIIYLYLVNSIWAKHN